MTSVKENLKCANSKENNIITIHCDIELKQPVLFSCCSKNGRFRLMQKAVAKRILFMRGWQNRVTNDIDGARMSDSFYGFGGLNSLEQLFGFEP